MPEVNPKVIAAGWAAASWIRALRATWDDPRLDAAKLAGDEGAASNQQRSATRVATATKPAEKK